MIFSNKTPTYQEVVDFCKLQQSESIHLDYKRDLSSPKKIAKTICAFANTMGGTIIVGVEDDGNNKPKLSVEGSIEGMNYNNQLDTQVLSIILGNIHNPIIPEIKVCDPVEGKTFIIINVPESNTAPHAIDNDTKIYYRTGDISNPEKFEPLADVRRIEWLLNRREKSEEFRLKIKGEAWERFFEMSKRKKEPFPQFYIYLQAIPLFPRQSLSSPKKIKEEVVNQINAMGYASKQVPIREFNSYSSLSTPNGIISDYNQDIIVPHYELNEFGFYGFCEDVEDEYIKSKEPLKVTKYISLIRVLLYIDLYLESLEKFYSEIQFWGIIEFSVKIKAKDIAVLGLDNSREDFSKSDTIKKPLSDITYTSNFTFSELQENRQSIFINIAKKISWDTGFSKVDNEPIITFLKVNNRYEEGDKEDEEEKEGDKKEATKVG